MEGDSTITKLTVKFCLFVRETSCHCNVFVSNVRSKMNDISLDYCITDFDTFKELSTLSKISRVCALLLVKLLPKGLF